MDTSRHLILKNGEDITTGVKKCVYNPQSNKWDVTFQNNKSYSCNYNTIEWVKSPEHLNPEMVQVFIGDKELLSIQLICVFHARLQDIWHIKFSNGREQSYSRSILKVEYSCLYESQACDCMRYLKQLAKINEIKGNDGEDLLYNQYEKLGFVSEYTAMAIYLNPIKHKPHIYNKLFFVFPFGGNSSQFKAVKNALCNQISVIQGPPGTGKTQTILNIIANILLEGKTVQIVSNNNSAIENVLEKLTSPKYNMDFLVAFLGNSNNKEAFVDNQAGCYPDISHWEIASEEQFKLKEKIQSCSEDMYDVFFRQEELAIARQELDSLLLEIKYFKQYCDETGLVRSDVIPKRSLKSETIMKLWQECVELSERNRVISFWFKIKSAFIYGISNWRFYKNNLPTIITLLQSLFYQAKKSETKNKIDALEKHLEKVDAKGDMDELTSCSINYLRAKLFEEYGNRHERVVFTKDDLWKCPEGVVKEYPIILSTTFASRSSLNGIGYDYIIMDEASQVDIATGALALSNAKNAVIVGDLMQLPNVVSDEIKKRSDAILNSYKLHRGYSYSENSFLRSLCSILPDAPQSLLREHYRCHPKIIGFCNKKFYNNELIIMTEDYKETDTLKVFKTTAGNHKRDNMNQRQIDVTIKEVLPLIIETMPEDIGIIAPYRNQVKAISKQLDKGLIEVHTVHKFQGREKDTIIITTVDDEVTDFSDNPNLLNVAVSRAKSKLWLVVSGNKQPTDSNIGDLISYIEYNNFEVVESEIYSVFDLLYSQYTNSRIAFLRKHKRVSEYDSENLMYSAIIDILNKRPHLSLNVICHQPLNMLIRNPNYLDEEECRYAMNAATHLDFLIYNRINKKPVFAIEVDGFHYHKEGTRQYERDRMKDKILKKYEIPLFRFATNGSDELIQIEEALDGYEKGR